MHPVLFKIGSFPVFSYGVLAVAGTLTAFFLAKRYARLHGMHENQAEGFFWTVVGCGIAGSKGLYILTRLDEVLSGSDLSVWLLASGGIWYGGVLGGMIGAVAYARLQKLNWFQLLDVAAIPILAGGAVGRIGCLLSGCCHGAPTDLPWAITYTSEIAHRIHGGLPSVPVHPSPVYEFLLAAVLIVALDRLTVLKQPPLGVVGLLFVGSYGIGRSVLELFRGDSVRGTVLGAVTTSQAIGTLTGLAAVTGLAIYLSRRRGMEEAS